MERPQAAAIHDFFCRSPAWIAALLSLRVARATRQSQWRYRCTERCREFGKDQ
jgi:hypothetical protein